jgi:hypothetical protein
MAESTTEAAGTARPDTISVIECYRHGWRSFSKWWIPICLISGLIFGFNILPRLMVSDDVTVITANVRIFIQATADANTIQMERASYEIMTQIADLSFTLVKWSGIALPFIAVFTALLLVVANFAVKDRKEKQGVAHTLYIAGVNVILAFVRVIPFFFLVIPGIYVYVKLFFVSLVMIEGKTGAWKGVVTSWKMTGGKNFWPLTLLLLMNVGVNAIAGVTVIGLIPSVGFTNTARAAAFQVLWRGSPEATLEAIRP